MKHTVTKAFSLLLAVLILAVSLASCGGKDNDRVSALTGQIGAGAMQNFQVHDWTGAGNTSDAWEVVLSPSKSTYEQFTDILAKGTRLTKWLHGLKWVKELEGKSLTKASFTLEADRAVTLTINVRYAAQERGTKTVTLEANKPQKIEFNFTECLVDRDKPLSVTFWRLPEGKNWADHYQMNSSEQSEWSQTIYKVTDYKLFCN